MLSNIHSTRMLNILSELRTSLGYLGVVTPDVSEGLQGGDEGPEVCNKMGEKMLKTYGDQIRLEDIYEQLSRSKNMELTAVSFGLDGSDVHLIEKRIKTNTLALVKVLDVLFKNLVLGFTLHEKISN